jgi:hypothetical protein
MASEFWGMTAFFVTTIIFSTSTLIYAQKLSRTQQLLSQLKGKANREQSDGK